MKKIMIAIIVISCITTFMIPTANAERNFIGSTIESLFELGKIIKGANTDPDLVLGKELAAYKINSKYVVVLSDGSYKKTPCIYFSTYDDKTKMIYWVAYDKNNAEDMQKIYSFKKMNEPDKKTYIKDVYLKFAKVDLGEIEAEPATSAQTAPKQEQSSATPPASK